MQHRRLSLPSVILGIPLLLCVVATGRAQSVDGAWGPAEPSGFSNKAEVRPLALLAPDKALSQAPLHVLPRAEEGARAALDALHAWNAAGNQPYKIGFERPLPQPLTVRLTPSLSGSFGQAPLAGGLLADAEPGWVAWGTHVRIAGAGRVRLHLTNVQLPAGSRLAVAVPGGTPLRFGLELLSADRDLWTPSVAGESLLLEVEVPAAALGRTGSQGRAVGFDVREALQIVAPEIQLSSLFDKDASCLVDAACQSDADLPNLSAYRHAIAQLQFIVPRQGAYLCTGSLLNDQAQDSIPYLLTANHCIGSQTIANSLEAFFDDDAASCNGPAPDRADLPRSHGATLLATGSADTSSDFTFLRLSSLPGGRFFLGWNADANAIQNGTPLFRLSHPAPDGIPLALSFSHYSADPRFRGCKGIASPYFLYEHVVNGATAGGSSGSPLLLGNGQVVGQLGGACGPDPGNICNASNDDYDGAFAATFPAVQQYLGSAGGGTGKPTATISGAITAIQTNTRFITVQAGGQTVQVSVPASTRITRKNRAVTFSVLQVGQQVTVTYRVIRRVNVAQLIVIAV
jgi:lysyl endopeptidase